MAEIKSEDGKKERLYVYYDGESVSGKVSLDFKVIEKDVMYWTVFVVYQFLCAFLYSTYA